MPLEHVHIGVHPLLAGDVHHAAYIGDGLAVDPCAVGLQVGPHREDAHMVHAQGPEAAHVFLDARPVGVEPEVEPAVGWGIVDAESHAHHPFSL